MKCQDVPNANADAERGSWSCLDALFSQRRHQRVCGEAPPLEPQGLTIAGMNIAGFMLHDLHGKTTFRLNALQRLCETPQPPLKPLGLTMVLNNEADFVGNEVLVHRDHCRVSRRQVLRK